MNIIFIDVDGTLLDNNTLSIPESAIFAIKEARKNSNLIYLNTGRSRGELNSEILEIGFDGFICSDGNYVENNEKILRNDFLPENEAKQIVKFILDNKLSGIFECHDQVFKTPEYNEDFIKSSKINEPIDLNQMFNFNSDLNLLNYSKIGKITFFSSNSSEIYKILFANYGGKLDIIKWLLFDNKTQAISINRKDSDKYKGIQFLLKNLNYESIQTFAFGDSEADISMIQKCDIGIAMGNASENVKSIAKFTTTEVWNNGIYNAFKKYGLIL